LLTPHSKSVTVIVTVTALQPHTQRNRTQCDKAASPGFHQAFRRFYHHLLDLVKSFRLGFVNRRLEVRFLSPAPTFQALTRWAISSETAGVIRVLERYVFNLFTAASRSLSATVL